MAASAGVGAEKIQTWEYILQKQLIKTISSISEQNENNFKEVYFLKMISPLYLKDLGKLYGLIFPSRSRFFLNFRLIAFLPPSLLHLFPFSISHTFKIQKNSIFTDKLETIYYCNLIIRYLLGGTIGGGVGVGGVGEGRAAGAGGVGAARLVGGAAAPIILRRA